MSDQTTRATPAIAELFQKLLLVYSLIIESIIWGKMRVILNFFFP